MPISVSPGMSNMRPAGRMRPFIGISAARTKVSKSTLKKCKKQHIFAIQSFFVRLLCNSIFFGRFDRFLCDFWQVLLTSGESRGQFINSCKQKIFLEKSKIFAYKMANATPAMRKRKLIEEGRVFQEKWESQYFCITVNGKIHCVICNICIATPKE